MLYFRNRRQAMLQTPVRQTEWFLSWAETSSCLMMPSARPVSWSGVRAWWSWSPQTSPPSVCSELCPRGSPYTTSSWKWPVFRYCLKSCCVSYTECLHQRELQWRWFFISFLWKPILTILWLQLQYYMHVLKNLQKCHGDKTFDVCLIASGFGPVP